ncbi:HIT domain-containing protein [Arthroderma uncinatum]|uniref:HIT domain-containing protein n=1 Tax=Arthroderma uncinatum TaxID=74035 RepID=UPI00144AD31B|nr:HIT domain-containing protein [Arthroderma uncinatum]KAF3480575.1 HIT domain-containing protein [Arthroderma uncinatum]
MDKQHTGEPAAGEMNVAARSPIHFGPFIVTPQVFFITPLSFALVNIKPLLPGHVLVCPIRRTPRLSDLTPAETTNLFLTVRRVSRMVERVYQASSLNVAIQDGVDAGQSVPHVHAHIIPRKKADLDHKGGSDAIYGMMDGEDGDIGRFLAERKIAMESKRSRSGFPAVDNESREPRSDEEMRKEAEMLAEEMEKEMEMERENMKREYDE